MKKIAYNCKLLSDTVLSSKSASEGNSEPLDYIPGSKFLGIVSKIYDENNPQRTLDIFHNGFVRFGDAHLSFQNERSLKVPASWFHLKGEKLTDDKYLHHKLPGTKTLNDFIENGIQLKQARSGYFTKDKLLSVENSFSIKTAYDRESKRSAESQMFGYFALKAGTDWIFYIEYDNEQYIEEVEKALEGTKRIGRSRSAQYGLADITKIGEVLTEDTKIPAGEICIYAESNLCFYDKDGKNTLQPSVENLNLPEGSRILWEKSQIRTRNYQTWNRKRYNRDADRQIIVKGSVFVIETKTGVDTANFEKGIGSHLSEGFGKVLINPEFLISENEKLDLILEKPDNKKNKEFFTYVKKGENDDLLIAYLRKQVDLNNSEFDIDKRVNEFAENNKSRYSEITANQWGQIRKYAKYSANSEILMEMLFNKEAGFLYHGQSENIWRKKGRRTKLEEAISAITDDYKFEFVTKLASIMAKQTNN